MAQIDIHFGEFAFRNRTIADSVALKTMSYGSVRESIILSNSQAELEIRESLVEQVAIASPPTKFPGYHWDL